MSHTMDQDVSTLSASIDSTADVGKREIGHMAVWTVSSSKQGSGVEQLRDGRVSTFWQSDGPQPHFVNVQFVKKMRIKEIAIYTDYKVDESYTPTRLCIRAGTSFHDLADIREVEFEEPQGWVSIPMDDDGEPVRASLIQVCVVANHQNGRDTHIRQLHIFSPRQSITQGLRLPDFTSLEFASHTLIR